jgi:hypothetical protein
MVDFEWPGQKRQLAVIALIALLVTAGCAGLGSPDETGDTTTESDNPDDPSDANESDNPDEDDSTGDGSEEDLFSDLDSVDAEITGEETLTQSVGALAAVDGYQVIENTTSLAGQNNQQQTVELDRHFRVDRPANQLAVDITSNSQGRTVNQRQFLLNGSFYQGSAQIAQQYGTEWLRRNVSESFDQRFDQLDQAARISALLTNASATLEGQTTIDGQQAYAVTATVNATTVTEIRPTVLETDRLELSLWLSTETMRPIQIIENSSLTEAAPTGELPQELDRTFTYRYGEIDITLPEAAKDAPSVSEVTQ